jgi:hypothetical protein
VSCDTAPTIGAETFSVRYDRVAEANDWLFVTLRGSESRELSEQVQTAIARDSAWGIGPVWSALFFRYVHGPLEVAPRGNGVEVRFPEFESPDCRGCPRTADLPESLKHLVRETFRSVSAPVVGWPGGMLAAHVPEQGQEIACLDEPVARMVSLVPRGAPSSTTASVRFQGSRDYEWGRGMSFQVSVAAVSLRSDSCERWTSEASVNGELILQAGDGAFVALNAQGPMIDTESPCTSQGDSQKGGDAVKPCNPGEVTIEIMRVPCLMTVPL